jgi:hypothetical protein
MHVGEDLVQKTNLALQKGMFADVSDVALLS